MYPEKSNSMNSPVIKLAYTIYQHKQRIQIK